MEYLRVLIIILTRLPGYICLRLFNQKKLPVFVSRSIIKLGPVYIKFIQVLSTRIKNIPEHYIREFAKLRDAIPVEDKEEMYTLVETIFDQNLESIFSHFPKEPIASGSVAVVYRAVLRKNRQDVAVKILKPGIRASIEANFKVLFFLVWFFETVSPRARIINLRGYAKELEELLLSQTDLSAEENNYRIFAERFSDDESVTVPQTFPEYSNTQALVMEFVHGIPPYEFKRLDQDRKVLASRVDFFLDNMIFLKGMCHADLHPGNFFWNQQGQLVLIDFGLMHEVPLMIRNHLLTFYLSMVEGYYDFATEYFLKYFVRGLEPDNGSNGSNQKIYKATYQVLHENFVKSGGNPVLSDLLPKLMAVLSKNSVQLETYHAKLLLTIVTIEGFLYTIDPEFSMMENSRRKRLLQAEYASIPREAEEKVLGKFGTYSTAMFEHSGSSAEKAWGDRDQFILDSINVKKNDFIIDVGCGRGSLLQKIEQRGAKGMGITISRVEYNACRKKGLDVAWTSWEDFDSSGKNTYPKANALTAVEILLHLGTLHENRVGLTDKRLERFFNWSQERLVDQGRLFIQALTIDPAFLFKEKHASDFQRITGMLPWLGFVSLNQIERHARPHFSIIENRNDSSDLLPTYQLWMKNIETDKAFLQKVIKKDLFKYLVDELNIFMELANKKILSLHRIVMEKK